MKFPRRQLLPPFKHCCVFKLRFTASKPSTFILAVHEKLLEAVPDSFSKHSLEACSVKMLSLRRTPGENLRIAYHGLRFMAQEYQAKSMKSKKG